MSTWLKHILALTEIEDSIKDDLCHTELHKLSVRAVYVLNELYCEDGQRPSDLAKKVGTLPTSFTPILDPLELGGFVKRGANKQDRRSILIFLTAKGKTLKNAIENAIGNVEVKYGEG